MTTMTIAKALGSALRTAMEDDPDVLVMGEDVGKLGGVFRVTDGLQKDFGEQRVLDTPLSESGIIGAAVGLALHGFRPVCEIQFDGFVFPGFDQIVSQLAKLRFRSQGRTPMPVVVRIPFGGGIGAVEHHSESPESLFAHVPGLRVVACSNPDDAHWMLRQAIACDDPVIFFEPKRRYWEKGEVGASAPAELFASRTLREGGDATLVGYGPVVRTCLDAAAASEDDLAVVDLRSLSPLDLGPVRESVRRTGRLVVVSEAPGSVSVASEVARRVQEECFYSLEAPVLTVTGYDTPYPPSRVEEQYLPDVDRVLDAVDRSLEF
ncbi:alpha-ketoacid dehydrogenase subunit beta [Rhodococcus aerolatus]